MMSIWLTLIRGVLILRKERELLQKTIGG